MGLAPPSCSSPLVGVGWAGSCHWRLSLCRPQSLCAQLWMCVQTLLCWDGLYIIVMRVCSREQIPALLSDSGKLLISLFPSFRGNEPTALGYPKTEVQATGSHLGQCLALGKC